MTEQNNTNFIGNLSTIIKTLCMIIAGYAIGYAVSIGLDLPIDATQLSETLFTILCAIGAYIDAKYPNTLSFLGNNQNNAPTEQQLVLKEIVLNEEYQEDPEEGC